MGLMEFYVIFIFVGLIAVVSACLYTLNKSQKEIDELKEEINKLKSQIDSYDK